MPSCGKGILCPTGGSSSSGSNQPTSFGVGPGPIDLKNLSKVNPEKLNAEIAVNQYNDYQNRYVPVENEFIGLVSDPKVFGADIERAGQRAETGFGVAEGIQQREFSRQGITLSTEEMRALERINKFGKSTAVGTALNTARRGFADLRLQGLNTIADFGRQGAAEAAGISGGLAQDQAQRASINAQNRAQGQSNFLGTLGTVATFAAFMAI
jgi:hypothetical protein